MTTDTADMLAIAEAIAPTWERRRADIEALAAPVRDWMLRKLAPQPGDTVLELAAGAGDTGFDAAELTGEHGRLISSASGPLGLAVQALPDAQRAKIVGDAEAALAPFASATGYAIPGVVLCAAAR